MIIKIDSRESDLYTLCKQKMIANENITVIQEVLPLGDIVICNNENKELINGDESICVSKTEIKKGSNSYKHIINKYLKL